MITAMVSLIIRLLQRYVLYNKWNFSDSAKKTDFNIAGRYWNEKREGGRKIICMAQ